MLFIHQPQPMGMVFEKITVVAFKVGVRFHAVTSKNSNSY
jgi:hypothetical protein